MDPYIDSTGGCVHGIGIEILSKLNKIYSHCRECVDEYEKNMAEKIELDEKRKAMNKICETLTPLTTKCKNMTFVCQTRGTAKTMDFGSIRRLL